MYGISGNVAVEDDLYRISLKRKTEEEQYG